jgi:elongation factor P hydroxylase
VHGPFDGLIDHVNGDSLDNRIDNLRLASRAQNANNSVKVASGFKNVTLHRSGRWRVQMRVNGKQRHFGYFDCKDEAISVAREMMDKYHGEFARY